VTDSTSAGRAFIAQSRTYLSSEYLPKIRRCLDEISEDDLWWRPNPESNSIGNLVLHLAGNIRQWVVCGIGGEPDARNRAQEFAAAGGRRREELITLLANTLGEVDQVLANLQPDALGERRLIQGMDVTVLEALYHAVEHFSGHTYQIVYITKLRTSADLGFYDVRDGIARARW